MATYNGSGNFVKVQSGKLLFGNKSGGTDTTYAEIYAASETRSGITYYGITNTASVISLLSLGQLTIGNMKTYSGQAMMYSSFYDPYPLLWDPDAMYTYRVTRQSVHYEFVNGIMIGQMLSPPYDWWNHIDDGGDDIIVPDDEYSDDQMGEGIVTIECNGYQHRLTRYDYTGSYTYGERERGYTEIETGKIHMGYHNSGYKVQRYTAKCKSYYGSSSYYYGIDCDAEKMKICQDYQKSQIKLLVKVGSSYGATGYLRFISYIWVSEDTGVDWEVEEWPFFCGFCIAKT